MNILTKKITIVVLVIALVQSCKLNYPDDPIDPDVKRMQDVENINSYISKYDLGTPDTTENGARYIIYHEGNQANEKVKLNDIVTFDFTGFYMEDSVIFGTTVPVIANSNSLQTLNKSVYTYSETGWSLRYVFVTAQYLSSGGVALSEAISASFKQMVVGDRVLIFLPSDQALNSANITAQEVVFYDITIVEIDG